MTASAASPAVPPTGGLAPRGADPRAHWPEHAKKLAAHLVGIYGEDDVLPVLAGNWIASQRSANTQKSYARGLKVFEEFARNHGIHPMAARVGLVGPFRIYLETAPTWQWVPGSHLVRSGPPYAPHSRASTLCAANSFLDYLESAGEEEGTPSVDRSPP